MQTGSESRRRSKFVTVIAWVIIIYWGLNLLTGFGGIVLVRALVDVDALAASVHEEHPIAWMLLFLFDNMLPLMLVTVLQAALFVLAGIGLLRRLNWARVMTIVLFALSIVWSLVSAGVMLYLFWQFSRELSLAASGGLIGGLVGGLFGAAVYLGLYGYVAYRLTRPQVREEFLAPAERTAAE